MYYRAGVRNRDQRQPTPKQPSGKRRVRIVMDCWPILAPTLALFIKTQIGWLHGTTFFRMIQPASSGRRPSLRMRPPGYGTGGLNAEVDHAENTLAGVSARRSRASR